MHFLSSVLFEVNLNLLMISPICISIYNVWKIRMFLKQHHFRYYSKPPYEIGPINIPISQVRTLELREMKHLIQSAC